MSNTYLPNTNVLLKVEFHDPLAGYALFDPSPGNIVLTVLSPDPTPGPAGRFVRTTYGYPGAVVKDGTGLYHYALLVDVVGEWTYRWDCLEPGKASALEATLTVAAGRV